MIVPLDRLMASGKFAGVSMPSAAGNRKDEELGATR